MTALRAPRYRAFVTVKIELHSQCNMVYWGWIRLGFSLATVGQVCFGDMDLSIDVADSNRYRQNWCATGMGMEGRVS